MIKELIHDPVFLAMKAEDATPSDTYIATDLTDTITFHKEKCVGMAANMIGINKRVIIFNDDGKYTVMFNPEIISSSGKYETEEGCLSLLGAPRKCIRYGKIKVKWQTENFAVRIKTYEGFTAEIIQHEIDHTNGILI